jgi:hypothetical protein
MTHLHCTIESCNWVSEYGELMSVIAAYLAHTIREHWDVLQFAHDNPDILNQLERAFP